MDDETASSRCGRWFLVQELEGVRRAFPMRCRRWSCPRCGLAMRNRLRHLIEEAAPNAFMTLTSNPKMHASPDNAFELLNEKFCHLIKRLRRHYANEEIEYLAIWELTRAGWPHLHVALRAPFIPQALISSIWAELTGAYIVDIRAVTDARLNARELSKYLTKDTQSRIPMRRWRASAGFLTEPFRPPQTKRELEGRWSVNKDGLYSMLNAWENEGFIATFHPEDGLVASRPLEYTASTPYPLLFLVRQSDELRASLERWLNGPDPPS